MKFFSSSCFISRMPKISWEHPNIQKHLSKIKQLQQQLKVYLNGTIRNIWSWLHWILTQFRRSMIEVFRLGRWMTNHFEYPQLRTTSMCGITFGGIFWKKKHSLQNSFWISLIAACGMENVCVCMYVKNVIIDVLTKHVRTLCHERTWRSSSDKHMFLIIMMTIL